YNEEAVRVELDVVNVLCKTLGISVSDLFEYIEDIDESD
ncbi:MAG: helix-turn-helix transcriptional regulator, partial [Pasteurella sp.]|nr:helix-turn-helix transcriptional regulator [Pasteurella sp.]